MSPLALCKDCQTEFTCVEEGCEHMRRAGPQVISLSPEAWDDFVRNMQTHKEPSPEMVEAARRHREMVRRPGDLEYDSWCDGDSGPAPSTPQGER